MLEAHVGLDTSVTLHSVAIPSITEPNDILIRVVCAACNPKDWKMPAGLLKTIADCPNSGDDLAGIVQEVGSAVTSFSPGDRVAALHELGAPFGAYAEFAIVKDFVCFHLPGNELITWEQAATVPMAALMACIALFGTLRLSAGPWEPVTRKTPLLVYGAATGIGSMAVKLAQIVNVHPVICVAGRGGKFVDGLIDKSKGDMVLDYRKGDDMLAAEIRAVVGEGKLEYAFDAVSEPSSLSNIVKVLKPQGGKITLALPGRCHELPDGLEVSHVMAGSLWKKLVGRDKDEKLGNLGLNDGGPGFARAMTSSIEAMLADGSLAPHPHIVYASGLKGLEAALKTLKEGTISASKLVIRIDDTPRLHEEKQV